MNTKLKLHFLVLITMLSVPSWALAQGTAFHYQGRLVQNGAPASGLHDFIFTLHDAETGGNALGAPVLLNGVMVDDGQIVAPLDFGAGVFTGAARWLEVSVRPAGEANYTLLNPRQAITPTPYAIHAATAGNVAEGTVTANQLNSGGIAPTAGQLLSYDGGNLVWSDPGANNIFSLNGNNAYYNAGNVGIGTTSPATKLTVFSAGYGLEQTDGTRRLSTYISESGGWFGTRSAHPLNFFVNDGFASLTLATNGGVGIGTTTPTAGVRLEVNGTVRLAGGGSGGAVAFGAPNAESGFSISGVNRADLRFDGSVLKLVAASGVVPPSDLNGIAITTAGNVGIGTTTPAAGVRLEVNGAVRLAGGGSGGAVAFGAPNAESGMSISGVNRADLRFDGSVLKLVASTGVVPPAAANGLAITTAGNVGIGTTAPVAKLHAETPLVNTAAVYGNATGSGGVGVYGQSAQGAAVYADGNAVQPRDKGGFVKAMAFINPFLPADQYVVRGYNSNLSGDAATTAPCGITVVRSSPGTYSINFGFNVEDRFFSVTTTTFGHVGTVTTSGPPNSNWVNVAIDDADDLGGSDSLFFIIVY